MRAVFVSGLALLAFQWAQAEPTEKEIYWCQSSVSGFESFRIHQIAETVDGRVQTTYQLKTGMLFFEEVWNQYGEAKVSEASPVFQSEFSKKAKVPDPILPIDPPPPEPQVDEYFLNVSIDQGGTGSLSVDGDLAPIECSPTE